VALHISTRGAKVLTQELRQLSEVERPKVVREVAEAAAQGDRSENAEYIYGKKRLREIDRRLRWLMKRLDETTVVSLDETPADQSRVFFGAIVTLEDEDGVVSRYQVVGPDESEPSRGLLSYQSPLGRAIMGKSVGWVFDFVRPRGEIQLEIIEIEYGRWLPDG
jgi:transcription elongation factor GreB